MRSLLRSPEFTIAARVGAFLGTPLAVCAGLIFWDMREDVRATKSLVADFSGTIKVHAQVVGDHGRRLNILEARAQGRSTATTAP